MRYIIMSNPKMSSLSASNNNLFFFPPHDPLTPRSLPPTPLSSNRDGLERVEVPDTATLHDLREAIQSTLNIPYHDQYLSRDRAILTPTSSIAAFKDLLDDRASLAHLGVSHGDMIYLKYSLERTVAPLVKSEPVGETVSLSQLVARWGPHRDAKDGFVLDPLPRRGRGGILSILRVRVSGFQYQAWRDYVRHH